MSRMGRLSDASLVIIGGTSGLGLSAARAFIREGARLVVVGKDKDSVSTAARELGENALVIAGEAALPATAEEAIVLCLKTHAGFHGLYHVAGGSGRAFGDGPLHEVIDNAVSATLSLNLHSVIYSNRAAVRAWLQMGQGGSILNLGSVLGFSPSPRYFASHVYAAAKEGIVGFSRSIAAYYAGNNIRVNVLAPGLVDTPMARRAAGNREIMSFIRRKQPLDAGRIGRAEDCDAAAVFFMSAESRFCTGQVLAVDGGWSVSEGAPA